MIGWHGGRRFGLHLDTPLLLALVRIKTRNRPSKWFCVIITDFPSRFLGHSGPEFLVWNLSLHLILFLHPFFSDRSNPGSQICSHFSGVPTQFESKLENGCSGRSARSHVAVDLLPLAIETFKYHGSLILYKNLPWTRQIMPSNILIIISDFSEYVVLCPPLNTIKAS